MPAPDRPKTPSAAAFGLADRCDDSKRRQQAFYASGKKADVGLTPVRRTGVSPLWTFKVSTKPGQDLKADIN